MLIARRSAAPRAKHRREMRRAACSALVVASGAVPAAACSADASRDGVERTDSAGVTIVRNTGPDTPLDWTIEEVLRLGGTDEGPESFFRVNGNGIASDADGRLYILDIGNFHVLVFDAAGEHIRTLGREGAGPGEMGRPYSLLVSPDGAVHVVDLEKNAIIRFDANGAVMDEVRLPPRVRGNRATLAPGAGLFAARDTTLNATNQLRPGAPLRTTLVWVPIAGDAWGEPIELARLEWRQPESFGVVGPANCPYKLNVPPIFYRSPVWRAGGDRVMHNSTEEYVVDVSAPAGALMSIRRDLPVVQATREVAAIEIGGVAVPESDPCYSTAEERADQATWLDRVPWIKDAVRTPDGTFLVLRRAPGQDPNERIDVFADDGAYMGTLPPAFPLSAVWRAPDEFITLELDDLRRTYAVVHRVRRGVPRASPSER